MAFVSRIEITNTLASNLPFSSGLFSQTGPSSTIVNTTAETTLIDGGVGTLSVPANTFKQGDAFWAYMAGNLSANNGDTLTIRIKTAAGVTLASTGPIAMRNTSNLPFVLDLKFVIYQTGAAGVASILTYGFFQYQENASDKFNVYEAEFTNNTTFDTTIPNTLDITAQWGTASPTNSIQSYIFVLNQLYG